MVSNIMKVRNVLSNSQAWQDFTCGAIGTIGRYSANNLYAVCPVQVQNGAAADAIDSDTINEISISEFLAGTDIPRKEAKIMRGNRGETKPAHFRADVYERAHWKKCYGAFWKLKIDFEEKNYR